MVIVGMVFILIGILNLVYPEAMFKFNGRNRWYKDPEPTDYGLGMTRLGGVLAIITGIAVMFFS
jgi:uncharacterized protein YjeT (DUF2065 family)